MCTDDVYVQRGGAADGVASGIVILCGDRARVRAAGDDGGCVARGARGRARPARTRRAAPSPLRARAARLLLLRYSVPVLVHRRRLEKSRSRTTATTVERQERAIRVRWCWWERQQQHLFHVRIVRDGIGHQRHLARRLVLRRTELEHDTDRRRRRRESQLVTRQQRDFVVGVVNRPVRAGAGAARRGARADRHGGRAPLPARAPARRDAAEAHFGARAPVARLRVSSQYANRLRFTQWQCHTTIIIVRLIGASVFPFQSA